MKKLILITSLIAITLSSCLKDSPTTVNFTNAGNIVNFPLGGVANFGNDALTQDVDTVQFAVDYATAKANPALTVTIAVDTTLVAKYNAANTAVTYLTMPKAVYSLSNTTVNIAAGAQYAFVTLIVQKNQLDPTKSYMLPIRIVSASGVAISSNLSIHYYHVIGNDFAGSYNHNFTRTPAGGNYTGHTDTFLPDSPTQFEVIGGYYTGNVRYVVSYTETGSAPNATYSNFSISINSDDVKNILTPPGIAITTPPTIVGYDSSKSYSYAQALVLFQNGFTYGVTGGSGARINLDQFTHL
jgi:Domain of unknown function (DUF1735)